MEDREIIDLLLRVCNSVYKQNTIEKRKKYCTLPTLREITSVSQRLKGHITLTFIASKVSNVMLLNRIKTEIEEIHRENKNGFQEKKLYI